MTTSNTPVRKTKSPAGGSPALLLATEVGGLSKGVALTRLDSADWLRWGRHLARRKSPAPLSHLTHSVGIDGLTWGVLPTETGGDAGQLIAQLQHWLLKGKRGQCDLGEIGDAWLKEAPSRMATAEFGIESLAWCHALPELAAQVPAALWCRLLEQLVAIAADATAILAEPNPLAQQILAGELPLTLAYLFPEIAGCAPLAKGARTVLSDGVMDLLDEGLPRGEQLSLARALLACWTRAEVLGEALGKPSFRTGAQDQYRNFVRHTICLSRADGSSMLSPTSGSSDSKFIDAALAAAGDDFATASAEALFFGQSPPMNGKRKLLLPTAVHSEWSEIAVLRANWSRNSPALAINYSRGDMTSELVSQQRVLWSGSCNPQIRVDGQPAEKIQRWEEVCWFSDDDVHYIELEAELGGGWKTQRQFLLARTDAILLIADAVIGPANAQIDYQCHWPTPAAMEFVPAAQTCEGTLQTGGRRWANVLPLALPEWRSDGRRSGSLLASEAGLEYSMSRRTQRLYVPLLVDLEPWRIKRELTWRQLVVGHNLLPQSPEVAVGYRVQLYKQHWLIYRSLAERASRTVLGQNIYSEFVCARFNRGGDSDTLIEIE